jgi:hypothetical protein
MKVEVFECDNEVLKHEDRLTAMREALNANLLVSMYSYPGVGHYKVSSFSVLYGSRILSATSRIRQ